MKISIFLIILWLFIAKSVLAQYEIKLGVQYSGTGNYYRNFTFYNEIDRSIGDFIKAGVGYSVFSDMSNDDFFKSINYSHQLVVKNPYVIISFLPVNFDNHEVSLGIGYALGKIEENTPSYYAFDDSKNPPDIKKILFRESNYWDSGYLARLGYCYQFKNNFLFGVVFQYVEYKDDNSPQFSSVGLTLGYKLKK